MSFFNTKELKIRQFIKKCDDLLTNRAIVPNFDEVADNYLAEGEPVEDDLDEMIKNKANFSDAEQLILSQLKVDLGKVLDQLENVEVATTPQPQPTEKALVEQQPNQSPNTSAPVVTFENANQPLPVSGSAQNQMLHNTPNQSQPLPPAVIPVSDGNSTPNLQVPTSVVQSQVTKENLTVKSKNGAEIWKMVRDSTQFQNDMVFDTLKASGGMPVGFKSSFFEKVLAATGDLYKFSNILSPKVSPHCLSFRDAAFGSAVGKILHQSEDPKHLKILTIVGCNNMPAFINIQGDVKDRVLRLCLVDNGRIISNIYTIRISHCSDPDKQNWVFDTSIRDNSVSLSFGELYLKCESKSPTVSLLFECSYAVQQMATGASCMVSCGWYLQPLIDNNEPVKNRVYEGLLAGGNPLEMNVGLGSSPAPLHQAQKSKKPASLKNSKDPYIVLKLADFNLDRELVDTIPDTLIASTMHINSFDFYCDSLISILGSREHPQWAGRIHNPFLSTFPTVADQPDVMDAIRSLWLETFKKMSRQERKDDHFVRTKFISTYLSIAIPALGSVSLGDCDFNWLGVLTNSQELESRRQVLGAILEVLRQNKSPFQLSNIEFRPLKNNEYMLDLLSPKSFAIVS